MVTIIDDWCSVLFLSLFELLLLLVILYYSREIVIILLLSIKARSITMVILQCIVYIVHNNILSLTVNCETLCVHKRIEH